MPKVVEGIYTTYISNVLKLANRKQGVTRPEIMTALSVSRPLADRLISEAKLVKDHTEGRTEFFKTKDKVAAAKTTPQPTAAPAAPAAAASAAATDVKDLVAAMVSDEPAPPIVEAEKPAPAPAAPAPKAKKKETPAQSNGEPTGGPTGPAAPKPSHVQPTGASSIDQEIEGTRRKITEIGGKIGVYQAEQAILLSQLQALMDRKSKVQALLNQ